MEGNKKGGEGWPPAPAGASAGLEKPALHERGLVSCSLGASGVTWGTTTS